MGRTPEERTPSEYICWLEKKVEELEQRLEAAENPWVKVEDRPPDEGELVVLTNHAFLNPSMIRYYCTGGISSNGGWYDPEDMEIFAPDFWMPIPALPDTKGGE